MAQPLDQGGGYPMNQVDTAGQIEQKFREFRASSERLVDNICKEYRSLEQQAKRLETEIAQLDETNQRLKHDMRRVFQGFQPVASVRHSAQVHSVAVSKNSKLMASATWKGELIVWDLANLKDPQKTHVFREWTWGKEMKGLYAAAFSQIHPSIVGCTSVDQNVYMWNYETRQCDVFGKDDRRPSGTSQEGHKDEVNGIDFHHLRPTMCTVSDDKTGLYWDYQQGKLIRKLVGHTNSVYSAAFFGTENGLQDSVATCAFDSKINVYDVRSGSVTKCLEGHKDEIIGLDYCSRHHMLASGSDDGCIMTWDVRKWQKLHTMKLENNEVKRVRFSRDGQMLAASCAELSMGVVVYGGLGEATPRQMAVLEGHKDAVFDVSWGETEDGRAILASGCHDFEARVWQEIDPRQGGDWMLRM